MIKRTALVLSVLSALYLLFRIWQEVRREGTETIVVVDGLNDDDYYERVYEQYTANRLHNGRRGYDGDPLAN